MGQYLIDALSDIGWAKSAPMGGITAITDQDVHYYTLNTGVPWVAWERRALIDMSKGYVAEVSRGADVFAMSPLEILEQEKNEAP